MKNMMFLSQGHPDGMGTICSLLLLGEGKGIKWLPLGWEICSVQPMCSAWAVYSAQMFQCLLVEGLATDEHGPKSELYPKKQV